MDITDEEKRIQAEAGSEIVGLHAEFDEESDRAAIILAAAMLDEALQALLLAKLVPAAGSSDPLFDVANAPLNSFSNKIDFAHRIGVISSRMCRDLHLVRKIRNDFAHRPAGCSLQDQQIKSRIEHLTQSHGIFDRSPTYMKRFGLPDLRHQFLRAVSWMLYFLNSERRRCTAIEERIPEFGYEFSLDHALTYDWAKKG
jgi:hypothetical protein